MSWVSNETGRPREEEGHKRINISANLYTRELLEEVDNKSKFVEYSIQTNTQPRWIFYQCQEATLSSTSYEFTEAAAFEYSPRIIPGNAILRIDCYFDYCSGDSDIQFRVTVNGQKGLELIERANGRTFTYPHVYSEGDLGFHPIENTFRGKDKYVFTFQFRPIEPSVVIQVKDISFHIEVVENPLLNNYDSMERYLHEHKW